ncbi:MAG: hypothetical protein ACYDHT_07370 [Solirubrobacteraceae bacterium]
MKCARCGDVIGVYEPLVLLSAGDARTTSAAAEPQVGEESGEHFHRSCYARSPATSARQSSV